MNNIFEREIDCFFIYGGKLMVQKGPFIHLTSDSAECEAAGRVGEELS